MTGTVKPTRRYDSPHRREQADSTRRHILDTARRLFEADGYAGTSMTAIARESGVVSKTVYLAFESKGGLLRALWQLTLSGEDDQAPVVAREWYREMIGEPDPERLLRLNARNSRAVKERAGAMMAVISSAAAADADARALWDLIQSDFHRNQATVVESLAGRKALRPGLALAQATDILWTINHPDVWQLLSAGCHWTPAQYEDWTAGAACSQLLGTPL
jgi:AcrR family transcriptional regulator